MCTVRNAFNRFLYRLSIFMNQRYGIDRLFVVLAVLYFVLAVLNAVFAQKWLYVIQLLILIYAMFRVLSKNTAARRRENDTVMKLWDTVKRFFCLNRDRIRYRKTHVSPPSSLLFRTAEAAEAERGAYRTLSALRKPL